MNPVNFLKIIITFNLVLLYALPSGAQDRLIGLTGGPGVGKSSVIERLQSKGMQVIPETFTLLHAQSEAQNKLDTFFADPVDLRHQLMKKQIQSEDARDKTKPTVIDETALGILFFGNKMNVPMQQDLYNTAENRRYDMIFMFEPIPKEFYKTTKVRQETYQDSKAIHDFLKKKYKETGLIVVPVPFDTPENRAQFIVSTLKRQYRYAEIIPDVINCFAGRNSLYAIQEFLGPIKLIEVASDDGKQPYRFFGVHKDQQAAVNFPQFKKKITQLMHVKKNDALQVIGDSNQFSKEGSLWARTFSQKRFARAGLIEYGFTGYTSPYKIDVNSLISEYANEHPEQAHRILANILGQTTVALNQWGSSGSPHIRNFVVVYNDAGVAQMPKYNDTFEKVSGFTTFGDDIIMSDYLFSPSDNDRFICFEGGAQSFKQAVNGLRRGVPVTFVYNLRKPENEKYFSAARFFNLINDAFMKEKRIPSKEEVMQIYESYKNTLACLWDCSRPDYETKKALFEIAIKEFIDEGIYEKIPSICSFKNAKVDQP